MPITPNKPDSRKSRTQRINIRARDQQCALIDKAAEALQKTRSEFMLEAACQRAEDILLDQQHFFVDEKQWEDFLAALDAPLKPNLRLQQLLEASAPWEV